MPATLLKAALKALLMSTVMAQRREPALQRPATEAPAQRMTQPVQAWRDAIGPE